MSSAPATGVCPAEGRDDLRFFKYTLLPGDYSSRDGISRSRENPSKREGLAW